MPIRWTLEAADDLERIADYLFTHTPTTAASLVQQLYDAPTLLTSFPRRGRPGKKPGTRELVVSGLPYLIVYQVGADAVTIVRILHGAQRWP